MRAQAEDGQLTGDQHFCSDLLVFASFETRTGMNRVLACPACRREQRIQSVGVGPLVGVRNHLPPCRLPILRGVHHAPLNLRGIKGYFQGRHHFFDLFFGNLKNSWCQHRRWRAGFGDTFFLRMTVCRAHIGSSLVIVISSSRRWPYIQRWGLICKSQSSAVGMRPRSSRTCCSPT